MATPPSGPEQPAPHFQPLAAVLAWLVPGAGHFYLGHTRRAILIAEGILGLFSAGLFIGGISCVDRRENFFWFLGESLAGPITLGVNYIHQNHFKAYDPRAATSARSTADLDRISRRSAFPHERPDKLSRSLTDGQGRPVSVDIPIFVPADAAKGESPAPPYTKSLGRANELGTLFCTIAGFMNLICIIDAAWRRRAEPGEGRTPTARAAGGRA
jgi:TM2 domain-containing membrane protein YozV